jgi:uroporphyrinogen III methyltransferase/synthase
MAAGAPIVWFVSAGPGDPRLRTVRGAELIASADVVVHDAELPREAFEGCGPTCERVVAERAEATAQRMVALAREGKRVVRVLVDDVFETFAPSEAVAVAREGIAIEVVPGVAPRATLGACAGMIDANAMRLPANEVGQVTEAFVAVGHARDKPAAIVVAPSLAAQRVVKTTLGEAAARGRELGDASSLLVMGGGAVAKEELRWFERRPLFGKRVLVTRAREQAGAAASLLRERGAEAVVVPTIEIHDADEMAPLERAVAALGTYHWVAFTSANGVERTWRAIVASGRDARAFGSARIAAIGPATARTLEEHGLRADVVAKEFRGEGLAEDMLRAIGGARPRVLIARAKAAREALPEALRAAGCEVDVVAAYETRTPRPEVVERLAAELERSALDAVLFTSGSTVDNLCDLLGPRAPALLERTRVASIGPVTTAAAQRRGVRVDLTASPYTLVTLVDALEASFA